LKSDEFIAKVQRRAVLDSQEEAMLAIEPRLQRWLSDWREVKPKTWLHSFHQK